MIYPTVEAHTLHLEEQLQLIQQRLVSFDVNFRSLPIVCSKLDLCILDLNVIMKSFSQESQNSDQVFHSLLRNKFSFVELAFIFKLFDLLLVRLSIILIPEVYDSVASSRGNEVAFLFSQLFHVSLPHFPRFIWLGSNTI